MSLLKRTKKEIKLKNLFSIRFVASWYFSRVPSSSVPNRWSPKRWTYKACGGRGCAHVIPSFPKDLWYRALLPLPKNWNRLWNAITFSICCMSAHTVLELMITQFKFLSLRTLHNYQFWRILLSGGLHIFRISSRYIDISGLKIHRRLRKYFALFHSESHWD